MCKNDARQTWEYAVTVIADDGSIMGAMDTYGKQGWELVQVISLGQIVDFGHYRMFWKRPQQGE